METLAVTEEDPLTATTTHHPWGPQWAHLEVTEDRRADPEVDRLTEVAARVEVAMEEEATAVEGTEEVTLPEAAAVMVVAMTEAVADMAETQVAEAVMAEVQVVDDLVVAEEDMVEDPRTTIPLAVVDPSSRQTERWMSPMRLASRMLWRKSRVI